jgi:hypothetical protein
MNIFELGFLFLLLLLIGGVCNGLSYLTGINAWAFVIPVVILIFLGFRWYGRRLERWR